MREGFEYAAARTAEILLALPPRPVSRTIGASLGVVAASVVRVRRRLVETHIAAALSDLTAAQVRWTARACYRHFGREIAEIAHLGRRGSERLPERVRAADAAVEIYWERAQGVGGVIVTGHLGNWEAAGAFLAAAGLPLSAVVKRQRNPRFDRWLVESRRRLGIQPVYMEDALTVVPGLLREGRAVALVADQDARRRGIFVPFLGRPASTFRGPAKLALAVQAPLFFGALIRDGRGYRAILEPIEPPPPGEGAEEEYTRRWVERLDHHVRLHPDQYFWFHRRWKTGDARNASRASEVDR